MISDSRIFLTHLARNDDTLTIATLSNAIGDWCFTPVRYLFNGPKEDKSFMKVILAITLLVPGILIGALFMTVASFFQPKTKTAVMPIDLQTEPITQTTCTPMSSQKMGGNNYRLSGFVFQTTNQHELRWKVLKYESQITKLKNQFQEEFKDLSSFFQDIGSEVQPLEDSQKQVVRDLYQVLSSVQIDLQNTERFTQEHCKKVRDVYNHKFLVSLREALEKEQTNPYAHKVAEILFTKIDLNQECAETVQYFDQRGASLVGSQVSPSDESLPQRLHELRKRIDAVPYSAKAPLLHQWFNSAKGQWNRFFDPYRQGNPVHVLYQLKIGEKLVKVLGMGTPTIEDSRGRASLTPEFIAFMKQYRKDTKKHLFVLNQNLIPKRDFLSYFINGDETARSTIIINAGQSEELKESLYVIALSKNSHFYYQSGSYKDLNSAEAFMKELHQQIFDGAKETTGCFIPETIQQVIIQEVPTLSEKIHRCLFDRKALLSRDERKLFIELYYDQLIKLITIKLDVDSLNISCKDAIDRGAASNAQLYTHCALISSLHEELDKTSCEKIESLMMARALFVRKRPPLAERLERFTESLEFYLQNAQKLKTVHKEILNDLTIVPVH